MKTTLLIITLAFCLSSYAQIFPNPDLGDQAVFMACINEENPYQCTDETFRNIIASLITPEIVEELKNSPFKDGLQLNPFHI